MMKKIAAEAWRYWKWLCVAFMTSVIVLGILAYLLGGFNPAPVMPSPSEACIDNGGRWNADTESCESVG